MSIFDPLFDIMDSFFVDFDPFFVILHKVLKIFSGHNVMI